MTKRAAALALILLASPVAAQNLDGVYHWVDTDPATSCDTDGYNPFQVTIEGNKVSFVETQCKLGNPEEISDMPEGTLYEAVCSGEGDTWTERMIVYETFDGVALLSRGAARTYTRCQ